MGEKAEATGPGHLGVFNAQSADGQITVRSMTHGDWRDYRDFYKGLRKPHHFSGYLQGRDLDAQETYDALFDATIGTGRMLMLGMWHGGRMIGQSSIDFLDSAHGPIALLAGSEIAEGYRGQRLINHFYDARMRYLDDIGFEGERLTTISPDNDRSIKAAIRNGFVNTGVRDEYGYYIFRPQVKDGAKEEGGRHDAAAPVSLNAQVPRA